MFLSKLIQNDSGVPFKLPLMPIHFPCRHHKHHLYREVLPRSTILPRFLRQEGSRMRQLVGIGTRLMLQIASMPLWWHSRLILTYWKGRPAEGDSLSLAPRPCRLSMGTRPYKKLQNSRAKWGVCTDLFTLKYFGSCGNLRRFLVRLYIRIHSDPLFLWIKARNRELQSCSSIGRQWGKRGPVCYRYLSPRWHVAELGSIFWKCIRFSLVHFHKWTFIKPLQWQHRMEHRPSWFSLYQFQGRVLQRVLQLACFQNIRSCR